MSLPPLNFLLPHVFTFDDAFTQFPLHIASPTSAAILSTCLLHHVNSKTGRKSIILNLLEKEAFYDGLMDREQCSIARFFRHDACNKGKFIGASHKIDVIHVSTLYELRSLLLLLFLEPGQYNTEPTTRPLEIADSQGSDVNDPEPSFPILAIIGFDYIHQLAGSWSAQSIHRTLASAVDAAHAMKYHLIIHDTLIHANDEESADALEIQVLDASSDFSTGLINLKVPMTKVLSRYIRYSWALDATGAETATWTDLKTLYQYTAVWETTVDGEVKNSRVLRS